MNKPSAYDLSEGCKGWAALAKAHRENMRRKWGKLADKALEEDRRKNYK